MEACAVCCHARVCRPLFHVVHHRAGARESRPFAGAARGRSRRMKAITQNLESGKLQVEEVPPPVLKPGGLLVHVRSSLISLGTEKAVIALANKGPIGKAKDRPDLVRKVLNKARQEGYWSTYQVVKNLMASPIPLGYSCAGDVMAVGANA